MARGAINDNPITDDGTCLNVVEYDDPTWMDDNYPDHWMNVDGVFMGPGWLWDATAQTWSAPVGE